MMALKSFLIKSKQLVVVNTSCVFKQYYNTLSIIEKSNKKSVIRIISIATKLFLYRTTSLIVEYRQKLEFAQNELIKPIF